MAPDTVTPAPWVPLTRAGCDVGQVASANTVLENTAVDIPKVFGAGSPEDQQLNADTDRFKDAEVADYVGVGVHCAQGSAFCATAKGVKFGQTSPSPTAVTDTLPQEPGGYSGFQGLFGHRYVAPQLGAGTPNLSRNGVQITNEAGNLVDENGNQINGAFLTNHPGFPGFGPINASQSLAYMADMLESGVPVVNGYIADIHGNENIPGLAACSGAPAALGPGTPCYVAQAKYYNAAFGAFFDRLKADGITPDNTEFVLSSDEGDHVAGANVGRAIQPTPANCDGVKTPCTYPAGAFGELAGNITGLLATQKNNTTPFSLESDSAPEFYVTGNPGPNAPPVRTLERDVSGLTAANPYTGTTQPITNYLADPAEEAILHMVNADPARTPTFALFAKPDYFLSPPSSSSPPCPPCVAVNSGFAYNHGDYAAEINTNYLGLAGPGVRHLGLDGTSAANGPNSAGPNSGQVVVANSGTKGTWVDETDIRPTLMYLTGLKDDYEHDGRVITEVLSHPNRALDAPGVASLGACYKQLNSSVGQFGNFTLQASTAAVESSTPGDTEYRTVDAALTGLDRLRDSLALRVKGELEAAAFGDRPIFGAAWRDGRLQGHHLRRGGAGHAPLSRSAVNGTAPPSRRRCQGGGAAMPAGIGQWSGGIPGNRHGARPARGRDPRLDRLDRHPGARHRPAQPRPVPGGGAGRGRRPAGPAGPAGGRVRAGGGRRGQPGRRGRRPVPPPAPITELRPTATPSRSCFPARTRSASWPRGRATWCSTG